MMIEVGVREYALGDYLAVGKSNERDANVANCEKGNEKVKEVMKVYFGIAKGNLRNAVHSVRCDGVETPSNLGNLWFPSVRTEFLQEFRSFLVYSFASRMSNDQEMKITNKGLTND